MNKHLFIFRSLTCDYTYLIGVVSDEVGVATAIAKTECWSTTTSDLAYSIKVDTSVEEGLRFCEIVEHR
jgi:hypothetical protein